MPSFTMLYRDVIEIHGEDAGLDRYPLFKEEHRAILNEKIRNRFAMREIAYETANMFLFALHRTMNEIMPYYNQLYESEELKIDPLVTSDITVEQENGSTTSQESKGSSASTSDSDSVSRSVASDTPQSVLADNGNYATALNDVTGKSGVESTGTEESNVSIDSTGKTVARTKGISGSQAIALMAYRESFLNIDVLILEQLDKLFMQLWATPESFFGGKYYGY